MNLENGPKGGATVLGVALVLCACGPLEPAGTPGALKEGGFVYCEDVTAPCAGEATIPDGIAVGSRFKIQYSEPDVRLSTPDSTKLEVGAVDNDGSTAFHAIEAGNASVEARLTSSDKLLDFVRLDLGDIDSLEFRTCPRAFNAITGDVKSFTRAECGASGSGTTDVDVSLGSGLAPTLCAFALDSQGTELAGRLTFDWAPNEGSVAELEMFVADDTRCATVGGLTQGTASVTVLAGTTSGVLNFTVGP